MRKIQRLHLDATAGNRKIWKRDSENFIYIDIQKKLEIKPIIFADSRCLPFRDNFFDNIFFDPPHKWGTMSGMYVIPDKETWDKKCQTYESRKRIKPCKIPSYYGWDIYSNRSAFIAYLYRSLKEFRRILKDDGLLWVKWNDMEISFTKLLALFKDDWNLLMRIPVCFVSGTRSYSSSKTRWFLFEKKEC